MVSPTLLDLNVRHATREDAESILQLIQICEQSDVGKVTANMPDLLSDISSPGIDLARDSRLAQTSTGQTVGYVLVHNTNVLHVRAWISCFVHPDYADTQLTAQLIDFAEQCVRDRIPEAPADASVFSSLGTDARVERVKKLYTSLGYRLVRQTYEMTIDMTTMPEAPVFPDGITIRNPLSDAEDRAIFDAEDTIFADHWGHLPGDFARWKHHMKDPATFDPTAWFLAIDDATGEIIGISLGFTVYPEQPDAAYIGNFGIKRAWRKQGLGLALLRYTFREFYKRDRKRVMLHTDASSLTGAVRLYERGGMHPSVCYDNYEKELRPGKDYRTQTLAE